MKPIDLHVHSTYSDGTKTPTELVEEALAAGLKAFALTDHDSLGGIEEAKKAAKGTGLTIIPGIELSTDYKGGDCHILGYFINPYSPALSNHIRKFIEARESRNERMCEKLREYGIDISYEELRNEYPDAIITRMHFAVFMYHKGFISSIREGFDKYVGDSAPCNIPREKITPSEAVRLIKSAGGVPVLAHPILYHLPDRELEEMILQLKEEGLAGIETIYSTYSLSEEQKIRLLARKHNLIATGGSDYHGAHKPDISLGRGRGKLFIPETILDELYKAYLSGYSTHEKNLMTFDLDGTLLNSEKNVPAETRKALEEAIRAGHIFSINTGRPLASVLKLADRLDLLKYHPLIAAFNGGLIYDTLKEEGFERKTLSTEAAQKAIGIIKKYGFHFHTYTETEVLCERDTEEVRYYSGYVELPYRVVKDCLSELPSPYKIIVMHAANPELLKDVRNEIMLSCSSELQCVFSEPIFLELLPIDSGKGPAIESMCRMLQIPLSNTYAFADAENDISMLKAAAHGVCMENACAAAKEAADYITFLSNDEEGLVPFIRELLP